MFEYGRIVVNILHFDLYSNIDLQNQNCIVNTYKKRIAQVFHFDENVLRDNFSIRIGYNQCRPYFHYTQKKNFGNESLKTFFNNRRMKMKMHQITNPKIIVRNQAPTLNHSIQFRVTLQSNNLYNESCRGQWPSETHRFSIDCFN